MSLDGAGRKGIAKVRTREAMAQSDYLGAKAVMNRDRWTARTALLIAVSTSLLFASEAFASEGALEVFPDVFGKLPILVLLFFALVVPVNQLVLKPVFRVLDAREEQITGTRQRADRLSADADEILRRYEQTIREVRSEAEQDRKQTLERARAEGIAMTTDVRTESKREVARAREEVAAALQEARTELRARSQELAREVAARALGRALS